ncbi:MAG TPA: DUF3995 domain-containing protein [Ktedonosporobacter sp.]|nr:DUF3995 domain-containing protein [Ktedonosporobacter sp.]
MNEQIKVLAGILIAAIFVVDGLLHVYWATGRTWPASDQLTLIQAILNTNKTRLLKPINLAPIATLLFLGALIVLARVHRLGLLGQLIPASLLQLGVMVVATGLLLRGLAGIVWMFGLGADRHSLFYQLNLMAYTPACLILFAAAVTVAFA